MRILGAAMRIFSYLFHFVLGAAMMALALVAWSGGKHTLQIGILPWRGRELTIWLFCLGLAGAVLALLAAKRTLRPVFAIWALAVAVMVIRGYFFTSYHFSATGFRTALYFAAATLVAMMGGLLQIRGGRGKKRRRPAHGY